MKKVLIITGCIQPNPNIPYLILKDSTVRLRQYINCIEFYILNSCFDIIIFGENSAYFYNDKILKEMAFSKRKEFEWLSFLGDQDMVLKRGKGYGEGEIIKYVLLNSKFKSDITCFFKVTGRLQVVNSNFPHQ